MSLTSTSFLLTAHFNDGPHSGTERLETWVRHPTIGVMGAWERADDVRVNGVTTLVREVSNLAPGTPYDVATRLTRSGAAQEGSTSLNPLDWPAGHRQATVQLPLDDVTVNDWTSLTVLGSSGAHPWPIRLILSLALADSDQGQADLVYEAQIDISGTWTPLGEFHDAGRTVSVVTVEITGSALNTYRGTTHDVRVRRKNTYADSNWTTVAGVALSAG